MLASTSCTPLKVLTPRLADRLRVFNQCARTLQQMGVRLLRIDPMENSLTIEPAAGFKIVGTLPGAFRHSEKGYVDVYVMYRSLLP